MPDPTIGTIGTPRRDPAAEMFDRRAGHGSAIGTLVERDSRYLVLVRLPDGHAAPTMPEALTAAMDGQGCLSVH